MGGMMEPGESKSESKTEIDPRLDAAGSQILDMMMQIGGMGPMAMMRDGPSVAAFNDAQMGVMDSTAHASNAFGIPAVSAASGLPEVNYDQDGLRGYNVKPYVEAQMSPEYMQMYDNIFGEGGMFANYLNGGGQGDQGQQGFQGEGMMTFLDEDGKKHRAFAHNAPSYWSPMSEVMKNKGWTY